MNIRSAPVALLFLLGACGGADRGGTGKQQAEAVGAMRSPGPAATGPADPVSEAAARNIEEKTDLYVFGYAYPAQVAAIGPLKASFEAMIEKRRAALVEEARKGQAAAREAGFAYHRHSREDTWQVVANTPRFLSLSNSIHVYSGGAHGMSGFDALVWDRRSRQSRAPIALFASPAALADAVREPFCKALDRQRAEKRGAPVVRADDAFSDCIDPVENSTIILGSTDGRRFDRIGFLIPPYNAGSYAEGSYEVALPVTYAVSRALRPEFRDAFALAR